MDTLSFPHTDDPYTHLEIYQKPELFFHLLYLVFQQAYTFNYNLIKILKKYKIKFNSMLEFGCAIAPITTTLFEFYNFSKKDKFFISDIKTLAFHYAAYKFRFCSNVIPVLLKPENHFALNLEQKVDLIFCITVFEHLNKPLDIAKKFHKILNDNGYLVFDFIKPGDPLDTYQAKIERDSVLDFIMDNFKIVYGSIDKTKKVNLVIAQKN